MNINRIAICFYGQWRTGQVCVPYLKEMFDMIEGAQVDYFCNVKNCQSFHAGPGLRDKGHVAFEQEKIEGIVAQINDWLTPVDLHVMHDDPNVDFNIDTPEGDFNRHGALSAAGIADVLSMKQRHEAKTGEYYDLVILTRYDVLYRPMYYVKELVNKIRDANDVEVWPNEPDSLIALAKNHVAEHKAWGHFTTFPRVINDLLLVMTGSYSDRILFEMIDYLDTTTSVYGNQHPPIYEGYVDLMTFHNFFEKIGGRIALPQIRAPGLTKSFLDETGEVHDLEKRTITPVDKGPYMIVARPADEVFTLNPKDVQDFFKINDYWGKF